jgi:hypothetical protein
MNTHNSKHQNILLRKIYNCLIFAIVACLCVYLWNTFFASSKIPATIAPTQNVATVQKATPKYKHTRIADIKVGERVVVSTDDTPKSTAVDPATWKKVTLYAEETWYDGTVDTINVVTLVPPEWITLHDAQVGNLVPIPLDVREMGLDENLLAKILAIERCPEIRAGPGRVVLTTVNHLSRGVCNLKYINSAGQNETIRPTVSHRFYSLDRKDWIHIGDARFGEKLQGLGNDIITVVSCQPLGKTERVYSMTVEDEHVYHVGKLNLLTHNNGCIKVIGRQPDTAVAKDWDGYDVLDVPNWGHDVNDAWVNEGIANKQTFYLASPIEGNLIQTSGDYTGYRTVFARELDILEQAGYVKVRDYMVHPDKLAGFSP